MSIKTVFIISIGLIFVLLHITYFCLLKNKKNTENYDISPSWYDRRTGIYKGSGEVGGVWTNSHYDIAREDPGLSWVL